MKKIELKIGEINANHLFHVFLLVGGINNFNGQLTKN